MIINLANQHDRVVIGLGSCYNVGKERYPFLALHREKMLLSSLQFQGIDLNKIDIAHIQDYHEFDEWLEDVLQLCKEKNITHFVTGNEKDILDVLRDKNMSLPFEFVNPEATSTVPYHATDMRNALREGNYELFSKIAAYGTKNLIANANGFNGMKEAMENIGTTFLEGRQTVDVVFTLQERIVPKSGLAYYKDYVLTGQRSADKKEFPNMLGLIGGEIKKFESPLYAAMRALFEKANLKIKIEDNTTEPAHATLETGTGPMIVDISFLNIYSNTSKEIAGQAGGSSQCFTINVKSSLQKFTALKDMANGMTNIEFRPVADVLKEGLAYQQTQMLQDALKRL